MLITGLGVVVVVVLILVESISSPMDFVVVVSFVCEATESIVVVNVSGVTDVDIISP